MFTLSFMAQMAKWRRMKIKCVCRLREKQHLKLHLLFCQQSSSKDTRNKQIVDLLLIKGSDRVSYSKFKLISKESI